MPTRLKCHCGGRPSCKLCGGSTFYQYQSGPRGWMPFGCPTCDGRGWREEPPRPREPCPTCRGEGRVDPGDAPPRGIIDVIWKYMFGA